MILFLFIQLVLLLIIIGLFYLLSWFWPPDSPWSPWWKTYAEVARVIQKIGKIKKTDVLYELGSGDAENLITLAKEFGIKSVGVEIDPWRVLQSKFLVKRHGVSENVTIIKKTFYDVSIKEADVVYVYLIPRVLLKLKEKILKELRPGTRVISYRYKIPYLKQIGFNKENILYVYEVPQVIKNVSKRSKVRSKLAK